MSVETCDVRIQNGNTSGIKIRQNPPCQLLKIIDSFLTARNFCVRNSNTLSSTRPIPAGVPQGSCLSPLVYTNDIPVSRLALFADNTPFFKPYSGSTNGDSELTNVKLRQSCSTTKGQNDAQMISLFMAIPFLGPSLLWASIWTTTSSSGPT